MAEEIAVGGITVPLSNTGKVLFPDDGITKGDLARYYADVADRMLPWLRDRPITMARYPDGINRQRIFQKNVPSYFPDWIRRVEVKKEGGVVEHAICDKPATLVYLANQACIEIHAFTSRVDRLDRPDQLVIDFDPPDAKHFTDVRRPARWARELLDGELGLTSFVRTTGGRGLHVHVTLDRRADFEAVRGFAHRAAEVLASRHPDVITTEQRKDKRGMRIYADVMRNAYAQTVVASYAVRARPGAPVATPLSWQEVEDGGLEGVEGLEPGRFTIATVRDRLDGSLGAEDPWADFAQTRHGLGQAEKRLAKLAPKAT
jgi:bifunctional non-homologous end joining protein LigD